MLINCLLLLTGFLLGAVLCFLWNKGKVDALNLRLADAAKQQETERKRAQEERDLLLAQQEKSHEKELKEVQQRFDEVLEKTTAQMKVATDEMLKQRQQEFTEASSQNLGDIVNPLKETIDKMKRAMDENTQKQSEMSGEMRANIANMMEQSKAAKESADELSRVFKHNSKVQGDFGEIVLEELLSSQGLTEGVHFDTQTVMRDANGNVISTDKNHNLRPDVILHLDQQREVIIDSKVSLTAYMDYVNADNEADRERFLKAHIKSLEEHVKELSRKDYASYITAPKKKMDYVIMFVPHAAALWTALNAQPAMWRQAMDKNVFIADEQTLFAALRIVELTWTQIRQAENHEKVFSLANEMVERVGLFMEHYKKLGKALDSARDSYLDAGKKLEPKGQSILQTTQKLLELGAKQSDKHPLPKIQNLDTDVK